MSSVCINLVNDVVIESALALGIRTEQGTATNIDFTSIDREILINGSSCIDVDISTDNFLELEEFFTISIESRDSRLNTGVSQAQIRINDTNSKLYGVCKG